MPQVNDASRAVSITFRPSHAPGNTNPSTPTNEVSTPRAPVDPALSGLSGAPARPKLRIATESATPSTAAEPTSTPNRIIDSTDLYCIGPVPSAISAQRQYIAKAENWKPERRALHDKLIQTALAQAQIFSESFRASGEEPAIVAMRGNTAAGKSRMTRGVPALDRAMTEAGSMASINSDNFKPALRGTGDQHLTSAQVHMESWVVSSRLQKEILTRKAADGTPASMLVDKRLSMIQEFDNYARIAQETGRKMVVYDVDAPLQNSLVGVLERKPGGLDPLPPYDVIHEGFTAIRASRAAVIDRFVGDPKLGSYALYGTTASGEKIKVASVDKGELTIQEPALYEELLTGSNDLKMTQDQVIDQSLVKKLTMNLAPERATHIQNVLDKSVGMTWKEALNAHSAAKQ